MANKFCLSRVRKMCPGGITAIKMYFTRSLHHLLITHGQNSIKTRSDRRRAGRIMLSGDEKTAGAVSFSDAVSPGQMKRNETGNEWHRKRRRRGND